MPNHANIVFLIDLQNGFARSDLTAAQGGSLYVPGGEKVMAPAADLIRGSSNTIFILSQDFHPADHISFASNHRGVEPLQDIYLKQGTDGVYRAIAFVAKNAEGEAVGYKAVTTDGHGHVTSVLDRSVHVPLLARCAEQKLWPDHCKQGTESALFSPEIMAELPEEMQRDLRDHTPDTILSAKGERGNQFFVVRKGMRSDLDSYGIATENDQSSLTDAPKLFRTIAEALKDDHTASATLSIGGLATNFCVEYSHKDLYRHFVLYLSGAKIATKVQFLEDISAGIDIPTKTKAWPNLAATPMRMGWLGTSVADTGAVLRSMLRSSAHPLPQMTFAL